MVLTVLDRPRFTTRNLLLQYYRVRVLTQTLLCNRRAHYSCARVLSAQKYLMLNILCGTNRGGRFGCAQKIVMTMCSS